MAALAPIALGAAPPAVAATFTAQDGPSLVAAVASANAARAPSTIELRPGEYAPESALTITGTVTLAGPATGGQAQIVGSAVMPVPSDLFVVSAGARATFVNVLISDAGYLGTADAINDAGSVDLENSTIAGSIGPALLVGVGASAIVRNSTISDSLDAGLLADGSATLINTTIAGNARYGVENRQGQLALVNTIVARNGIADCSVHARTTDHSLDGDGTCGVGALSHVDPALGPVRSNGGPTPTRALLPASPAINAGDAAACPREDQRHYARPPHACDIGAFQSGAAPPAAGGLPGSGGAGAGIGSPGRVPIELAGHGSLRGHGSGRISFTVKARVRAPHGSFTYHDAAARVWLKATGIASVVIDPASGTTRIVGSGTDVMSRRRLHFNAIITDRAGARTVRVKLSTGYAAALPLLRGALALIYDRTVRATAAGARFRDP